MGIMLLAFAIFLIATGFILLNRNKSTAQKVFQIIFIAFGGILLLALMLLVLFHRGDLPFMVKIQNTSYVVYDMGEYFDYDKQDRLFSLDTLKEDFENVKQFERYPCGVYRISVDVGAEQLIHKKMARILTAPFVATPEIKGAHDLPKEYVLVCDEGTFHEDTGETGYVVAGIYDGQTYKAELPPVPGCIYTEWKEHIEIQYPELARTRFKQIYPLLYDQLEKNGFKVTGKKYF